MKSGFARNEVFQHELRSSYLWFRLCVREASARPHSRRHGATCYWIRESSIGKAPPSGQTKPSISSFNFFDFLIFFSSFTVLSHPYSSFWISWLVSDNSSTFLWNASSRLSCNSCPSLAARCISFFYRVHPTLLYTIQPHQNVIFHIHLSLTQSDPILHAWSLYPPQQFVNLSGKTTPSQKEASIQHSMLKRCLFSTLPVQLRFHQRNSQLHVLIFGMAKTFWI